MTGYRYTEKGSDRSCVVCKWSFNQKSFRGKVNLRCDQHSGYRVARDSICDMFIARVVEDERKGSA